MSIEHLILDLEAKAKWQMMCEDCEHEWPAAVLALIASLREAREENVVMWPMLMEKGFAPTFLDKVISERVAARPATAEGDGT